MAEPFKNMFDARSVEGLADALGAAGPFDRDAFIARATDGLESLELKARVDLIAHAIRAELPDPWPDALAHLVAALPAPSDDDEGVTEGFVWWPLVRVIALYGVDHPDVSIPALREATQRFSAEFAIRPYLRRWPDETFAALDRWVGDPNLHVRRLVSEGTRPRLPWGERLRDLQADPRRSIALLHRLVDDPELYVRRSVANHLGDIAKDHPELAVDIARGWLESGDEQRRWVVEHALRHLVKQGHASALALLGFGAPELASASLVVTPASVGLPGDLALTAILNVTEPQELLIDYVVHYVTARGTLSPKTYKWTRRAAAGEVVLDKTHRLRPITTRRFYAGEHRVELQVNGHAVASAAFHLEL